MKEPIPDIIYTDGRSTYASLPVFSNNDGNIKYLRADLAVKKEELMEWLEQELRDSVALENCSNDDADRGRISAYEKVIDKIKSL